ncbi:unnamed protein product [Paramecium octaurelia]|uniref:Uncharacterized protein n=1 Tax=Paramecium octaurelia TaxID=43137 RepID=A0A8S1U7L8_PAROT|nr:unnamed protein product [Paramecium octaurelia]
MQKVLKVNFGVLSRPKLHIFDKGAKHTPLGIRATIHGGTSFSGIYMGGILGNMGSELIFPYSDQQGLNQDEDIIMKIMQEN